MSFRITIHRLLLNILLIFLLSLKATTKLASATPKSFPEMSVASGSDAGYVYSDVQIGSIFVRPSPPTPLFNRAPLIHVIGGSSPSAAQSASATFVKNNASNKHRGMLFTAWTVSLVVNSQINDRGYIP